MRASTLLVAVGLLAALACSPQAGSPTVEGAAAEATRQEGGWTGIDPPAARGALAPRLSRLGERPLLSWLEPVAIDRQPGHRLVVSVLGPDGWSQPSEVTRGSDLFANWADLPAVVEAPDGSLVAHWLEKVATPPYAYHVRLSRSEDGGGSWEALGRLHGDDSPQEHGFVSWVVDQGALRAFWLDGAAMGRGEPMALHTALVDGAEVREETQLDERVCECCATAAASVAAGSVVVYRDRSETEVRDIAVARRTADGWSEPRRVREDDWVMPGCPVNGPAVATEGDRLAVGWFTAAGGRPRVLVALSEDGGAGFGEAIELDRDLPLGRVGVAPMPGGVAVSWLATRNGRAQLRLQAVSWDGTLGDPVTVAETGSGRTSGFPRLAWADEGLVVVWVEATDPPRLRGALWRPPPAG